MNGLLLDALYAKYHAEKAESVAKLNIYLSWSVGIGEHPQHVEEMDKLVDQFAIAQGKLDSLKSMISHIGHSELLDNIDATIEKTTPAVTDNKELLND
jgi:hypothetical protein